MLGLSIPLLGSSRTTFAVCAVLGILLMVATPGRLGTLLAVWRSVRAPLGIALIVLLTVWLAAALGSFDIGKSMVGWLRIALVFAVGAAVYQYLARHEPALRASLRAVVIGSLISSVIALVGIYLWSPVVSLYHSGVWREIESQAVLKAYGSVAALLIPTLLACLYCLERAWKAASLAAIVLNVVIVAAVQSNAGFAGLIVAIFVGSIAWALLWQARGGRRRTAVFLGSMVVAVICLAVVVALNLPTIPDVVTAEMALSTAPDMALPLGLIDAHRQYIWAFSLNAALETPVLGHGIDVSNYLLGADKPAPAGYGQAYIPGHPHNWALEIFVDTGALGLLTLLGVIAALSYTVYRSTRSSRVMFVLGITLIASFWGSSLFNFSIWATWWDATFVLLVAQFLALSRSKSAL